jgi:hypothetical protein
MKITKRQLKRIIKEEKAKLLAENRPGDPQDHALDVLDYIQGLVTSTAGMSQPEQTLDLIFDAIQGYRQGL